MVAILERRASKVIVEGLDKVRGERLRTGQNILLLGLPFSGKTTLAIQFLVSGLRSRERGLVITTNDTPAGMGSKASAFECDLREYEDRN